MGRGIPGHGRSRAAALVAGVVFLTAAQALAATLSSVKQFGSSSADVANSTVVLSGVYVAGQTAGAFGGESNAGKLDAFLQKQRTGGGPLWVRIFGTAEKDRALSVTADASGVYVAGTTGGTLPGQGSAGGADAFVRKYDSSGNVLWTRQFGTDAGDDARGVVTDPAGDVYVAGTTKGEFAGQASAGGADVFVRKYDASGNEQWTFQFGSDSADKAFDVAADSSGVYVTGRTAGELPGQTSDGGVDGFIRKLNAAGQRQWIRQFGTSAADQSLGVDVAGSLVYAAGSTKGTFPGQPQKAGLDAFVRVFNLSGVKQWTRQFGTLADEAALGVSTDSTGATLAGWTSGALPNQVNSGGKDFFGRKYDTAGQGQWVLQFGGSENDVARAVDTSSSTAFVVGSTSGSLPGTSSKGGTDAFSANIAL